MDRRTFLKTGAGAVGASALAACNRRMGRAPEESEALRPVPPSDLSVPAPRPTVRMAGEEGDFPSPFRYFAGPGYALMSHMYDPLLLGFQSGELVPWLASEYIRSPDGLTYSFTLRDGVRWHDGKPLTPQDVVFSFEYYDSVKDILPPALLFRPHNIARVRATGQRTVDVVLDRPVVTFARGVAATFPIVPKHVWSSIPDPTNVFDPKVLVGTGPYRLQDYTGSLREALFVANDDFFLGKPFVKRIEYLPAGDPLAAILAGEIDTAPADALKGVRRFNADRRFGIVRGKLDSTFALYFNLEKGGALADRLFRQACARAIDRRRIARTLSGGEAAPGNPGFLPPGHPFHAAVEQYPFDPKAAGRLLDRAGYREAGGGLRRGPGGKPLRLKMIAGPFNPAAAEMVQEMLGKVGVKIDIEPVSDIFFPLQGGKYELALGFAAGLSGDPDFMRTIYASTVPDRFFSARGYREAEFDDLAEKQLVTFDEAERKRLVTRMQQIVARDVPLLHLYYPDRLLIFRRSVFDQWSFDRDTKLLLVTGRKDGQMSIRPVKEA